MNGKKVVQVVKTFDGALWAVQQVKCLIDMGCEVHVVAPSLEGRYLEAWEKTGAILHALPCEFPVKKPWLLPDIKERLRTFMLDLKPQLIHSHFVSTTLMLRYALRDIPIPRIFQVPGPLHLEFPFFGQWETMWADQNDYWIASSKFIQNLYIKKYGINPEKVFLSYYGTDLSSFNGKSDHTLREKYNIPEDAIIAGNVSFIYPPKRYLGQTVGLKGHELMIESLHLLMQENPRLWAVFVGQQWGTSQTYFNNIKESALKKSNRFIFTGYLPQKEIISLWKEFDLALHIPSSENCGGVIEPMLNSIPTVTSNIGGLPEVVIDGKTGYIAQARTVDHVTQALRNALDNPDRSKAFAKAGSKLVETMFDVRRTSREINLIYEFILGLSKDKPNFEAKSIIG